MSKVFFYELYINFYGVTSNHWNNIIITFIELQDFRVILLFNPKVIYLFLNCEWNLSRSVTKKVIHLYLNSIWIFFLRFNIKDVMNWILQLDLSKYLLKIWQFDVCENICYRLTIIMFAFIIFYFTLIKKIHINF